LAERTPGVCSAGRSRFLGDEIMTTLPVTNLERIIPLNLAAKRSGLSEATLRNLVETGKIRAAVLPGGEIGVGEKSARQVASYEQINERLRSIRRDDFEKLRGKPISISEATRRYGVPGMTLRGWIKRDYVAVLANNHPVLIDNGDVAYCVAVWKMRKSLKVRGPLLDDKGYPYQLKHPWLSSYRKRKKDNHTSIVA
jgi:hypothetical protein